MGICPSFTLKVPVGRRDLPICRGFFTNLLPMSKSLPYICTSIHGRKDAIFKVLKALRVSFTGSIHHSRAHNTTNEGPINTT